MSAFDPQGFFPLAGGVDLDKLNASLAAAPRFVRGRGQFLSPFLIAAMEGLDYTEAHIRWLRFGAAFSWGCFSRSWHVVTPLDDEAFAASFFEHEVERAGWLLGHRFAPMGGEHA